MGKFDGADATSPEMPDPNYPSAAQFDLRLENSTLSGLGIAGDLVRCVDLAITGIEPADGDLVLVEITHQPLSREERIMRVAGEGRTRRLLPFGQNTGDTITPFNNPDVRIVAKILYSYRKI